MSIRRNANGSSEAEVSCKRESQGIDDLMILMLYSVVQYAGTVYQSNSA